MLAECPIVPEPIQLYRIESAFCGLRMVVGFEHALSAAVDRELAIAKARFGSRHFDLICLENSRGDTLSDGELLARLKYLNRTGSQFAKVLKEIDVE